MTGPVRQILMNGAPTSGRFDDTHVWGAGGLITAAPIATDGHARYLQNEAAAAAARDAAMEVIAARIFAPREPS